jgi:hypothetical protein
MPPLSEIAMPGAERGDVAGAQHSWIDDSGFLSLSEDDEDGDIQSLEPLVPEKKRVVKFCEHALLFEIDRIPEEYKEDCWLTYEEFIRIKGSCMTTVMQAIQPDQAYCHDLRGLEHKTPQGMAKRQQAKKSSIQAVLEEQTYQSALGFKDDEWLASIYRDVASRSLTEAKIRGMRDELAIKPERQVFYNDYRQFIC